MWQYSLVCKVMSASVVVQAQIWYTDPNASMMFSVECAQRSISYSKLLTCDTGCGSESGTYWAAAGLEA